MSKHTMTPCTPFCKAPTVEITPALKVCSSCYMTKDESLHWGEMSRNDRRTCQKFAKKRMKFHLRELKRAS